MEGEAFISYLDERGEIVEGFFIIVDVNGWKISFKTKDNIITIPMARVLKIKEKIKRGEGNGT